MRDDLLLSPSDWQTCKQTWITSESNKTGSTQGDKSSWNNKNQVFGQVIPLNVQLSRRDLRAHHWRRSETIFSSLHSHIIPSNFCWLRYCFLCQHTVPTGGVIEITWRVRSLACLWRSYSRWHSEILFFSWCGSRSLCKLFLWWMWYKEHLKWVRLSENVIIQQV